METRVEAYWKYLGPIKNNGFQLAFRNGTNISLAICVSFWDTRKYFIILIFSTPITDYKEFLNNPDYLRAT